MTEPRQRLHDLWLDATKDNIEAIFKEALRISDEHGDPDGVLESLSMMWLAARPGEPVPGSPAAEAT